MLPTSETYKRNGATMYALTYGYDARGNVQSVSNGTETTTYEYDALNRLTKETINGTVKSYTYNNEDKGRMSSFNGNALTYDNCGRLTNFGSTTLTYDNYGNRLTKGNSVYTWTRGRLLQSVGGTTFEYDAKGRRTKKGSMEYYYDGDKLIAEVRSNNTLYYFYDAKGVCGFRYNGEDYEYIKNLFGDIVGIAQGVTLVARYEYDIWGNCTVAYDPEGIGAINPFRYRGYYFDTESGLYYLQSRYYDPEIGQFISMDTPDYLAPETIGGVDLYAYCGYNPVMYVDPSGHLAISMSIAIFLALYGETLVIAGLLVAGTVAGGVIGYNISKNSSEKEPSLGDLVYGTILGAVAGFAVVGAVIGLAALTASLVLKGGFVIGALTLKQIALQGFAYFNIGTAIFAGLAATEAVLIEI